MRGITTAPLSVGHLPLTMLGNTSPEFQNAEIRRELAITIARLLMLFVSCVFFWDIKLRDKGLVCDGRADVAFLLLARGQFDWFGREILVFDRA